jgi:hypothetical protein
VFKRVGIAALVFLGVVILFQASVIGQTSNATLIGTIRDPSGAVLPMQAAFDSGAQFISTDYYRADPNIGSDYRVTLPGGGPGRWNPVLMPPLKNLPALE